MGNLPGTSTAPAHGAAVNAERFAQLLEAAPDAILEVDPSGHIVLANSEAVRIFGWSREELIGLSVEALLPDRFRYAHVARRQKYSEEPVRRPMGAGLSLYALRKEGAIIAVDIKLSPLSGPPQGHVMCVVRDMTQSRAAEEEISRLNQSLERRTAELTRVNEEVTLRNREVERANRLKSEFLASMSHELRTPLNTILGFSELLAEESAGGLNDKQKRFVTHIQRDASHLLELINDILDLSKIEAGRLELHLQPFAMAVAVAEVLTSVRPLAATKNITLDSDVDTALTLQADRLRFKEILYNLLSNALKFTPAGGRVWINSTAEGESVRLVVGDSGIGIQKEDVDVIFESFRQASATTKGVREGTGLGLAITKRLVEHHGGRIWVESEPGKGSQFFVELPSRGLREATGAAPETAEESDSLAPAVMVTSHNAAWREEIAQLMRQEGFQAVAAGSGADALFKAKQKRPNVILLDMEVAGKSGWETLHELKTSPEVSSIPVIIAAPSDERKMGKALGAADCLVKPFSNHALLRAVRKVLNAEGALQVLIVDDDSETRQLVADTLVTEGHGSLKARNASEALKILRGSRVDAIALDLILPGKSGFELLAEIRAHEKWAGLPVVVLTVKDLSERERESLAALDATIFAKGSGWRPQLLEFLRRVAGLRGGKRVLIADDNPAGRELVREALSGEVAAIIEASDGREALQKIRETRPDLVLLDIQMPELDGYQVIRAIRADAVLQGLRVVALTAFAMQSDRERALDAGFDDYIAKPVTLAKLKAQLEPARTGRD